MNVKELMIGDLVQQRGCTTPSAVAGLTSGKIHTIWADGSKHSKDAYYFDPIPLTEEILEKNGFILNRHQGYMTASFIVDFGVGVGAHAFWWRIGFSPICPIDYVHELQHALRLYGLNDLADNLKV